MPVVRLAVEPAKLPVAWAVPTRLLAAMLAATLRAGDPSDGGTDPLRVAASWRSASEGVCIRRRANDVEGAIEAAAESPPVTRPPSGGLAGLWPPALLAGPLCSTKDGGVLGAEAVKRSAELAREREMPSCTSERAGGAPDRYGEREEEAAC